MPSSALNGAPSPDDRFMHILTKSVKKYEDRQRRQREKDQQALFWKIQRRKPVTKPVQEREEMEDANIRDHEEVEDSEDDKHRQTMETIARLSVENRSRYKEDAEKIARRFEDERRKQEEIRLQEQRRQEETRRRQQEEEERRRQEEEQERRRQYEEARQDQKRRKDEEARRRRKEETQEYRRRKEGRHRRRMEEKSTVQDSSYHAEVKNAALLQRTSQMAQIKRYDLQWAKLINIRANTPPVVLKFTDIPWPVFDPRPGKHSDMNSVHVAQFLLHPGRVAKGFVKVLRDELLRWHPDKFMTLIYPRVVAKDQKSVEEGMQMVSRVLTQLKMAHH